MDHRRVAVPGCVTARFGSGCLRRSLVGAVLLVAGASACGSEDDGTTIDQQPILEVGDCIADVEPFVQSGELVGLEVVDCRQPHEAEVYGTHQVQDATSYPGDDAVQVLMARVCDELLAASTAALDSDFVPTSYVPDAGSWGQGVRTIVCFVEPRDGGKTVGSVTA